MKRCPLPVTHGLVFLGALLLLLQPHLEAQKPKSRPDSVRALLVHLGVGEGATVADVGAGGGQDTWIFADIVGAEGKVYAEDIDKGRVESLKKKVSEKELTQIEVILGKNDDPGLPESFTDLVYLNRVYHHLSKPRLMLRCMWRALRPGGYLVVVDERRGVLREWIPRERRERSHHWIAETTVVREAREAGFEFSECAEEFWYNTRPFVLVFRRPAKPVRHDRDPDPFLPLDPAALTGKLLPEGTQFESSAVVALGEGRKLLPAIAAATTGETLDVVLEEWATRRDERPPTPEGVSLSSRFSSNGDPGLGFEPLDAVFFLDTYHRLFSADVTLAAVRRALLPRGSVTILDRAAPEKLERRLASHRRMISPDTVTEEMEKAGFYRRERHEVPIEDRFLLVFDKWPADALALGGHTERAPVVHERPEGAIVPVYRYRPAAAVGKVAFYSEYGAQNDEPTQYGGGLASWRDHLDVITEYSTFFPITLRSADEPKKLEWAIDLAQLALERKQLITFFGYGREGVDRLGRALDILEKLRDGPAIIRRVFANHLADEPYLGGRSPEEMDALVAYFDEKIQSRYPHIQSWINFAVSTPDIRTWGTGEDGLKRLPRGLDIVSIDWYAYLGNGRKDNWGNPDIRIAERKVLEFMGNFLPEQTRRLREAIRSVFDPDEEPMMLLIGNSSYVWGITHPTTVSVQDAYFEYVKSSEWAGLMWWTFEDYKDCIGGRRHEIIRSHQRHGARIREEKLFE